MKDTTQQGDLEHATSGIILFGGSFNPVHHGHLIAARSVAEHLGIERVTLIPSANPPHKTNDRELASAEHRLRMAELATEDDPLFSVSDYEIREQGPSFTINTVQAYRASLDASVPLYWIIGGDSLPELHTWYRIGELIDACEIVTAVRPGYEMPDLTELDEFLSADQVDQLKKNILPTPRIDISATDIRNRLRQNKSIRYLVPAPVEEYILANNLYRQA
jgi:nicotinate-nucleotide adenylyltransferase